MKKNGFTLVELIAVIVILIIIILLAVTAVKKSTDRANDNAINANAISYVKAVNEVAVLSRLKQDKIKGGIFTVEQTSQFDLSLSGDKPTGGYLYLEEFEVNCSCLEYGKYYIVFNNGKYNKVVKGTCPQAEDTCDIDEVYVNVEPVEFDFTGEIATFVAPKDGTYKLEVWGAQGGSALKNNSIYEVNLGYGGYSSGFITLNAGDKLYINVGGRGLNGAYRVDVAGGYNGGGSATNDNADDESSGSGGGATHIAYKSGLLASLANSRESVIIVAGGGGGSSFDYAAGSGGGFTGGITSKTNQNVVNQTQGFAFGIGQNGSGTADSDGVGGGGGGWFGGYMNNVRAKSSGSGGSGYIGYNLLTNKVMYCYNCTESSEVATKTVSTTCVSETPEENCAKSGNGYAKISFLN